MTAEEQLAELQATFDEFVVSSKEVEASLAQELEDESAALSKAKGRIREMETQLENARGGSRTIDQELTQCQARVQELETEAAKWREDQAQMEERMDGLEESCRRTEAANQDLQAQLEQANEDYIIAISEFEEAQDQNKEVQERYRIEVQDLEAEVEHLRTQMTRRSGEDMSKPQIPGHERQTSPPPSNVTGNAVESHLLAERTRVAELTLELEALRRLVASGRQDTALCGVGVGGGVDGGCAMH